jgi:Tol biopolymer transport system component
MIPSFARGPLASSHRGCATLLLALATLPIETPAQERPESGQAASARLPGRIFLTSSLVATQRLPQDETRAHGVIALDPNDATWQKVVDEEPSQPQYMRVSPDGRLLALSRPSAQDVDPGLWIFKTSGEKEGVRMSERRGIPCWSPDGRSVLVSVLERGEATEYWRVAADGSSEERVPIPPPGIVLDATPLGPWLLTRRGRSPDVTLSLVRPDGSEERRLLASSDVEAGWRLGGSTPRFSPDGRNVLACQHVFGPPAVVDGVPRGLGSFARAALLMVDVDGGRSRRLFEHGEEGLFIDACWSPDGKTVAVVDSVQDDEAPDSKRHWQIELADTQGNTLRKIRLPEPLQRVVRLVDWR